MEGSALDGHGGGRGDRGTHGQIIAGSIAATATSLFAVVFLARWFPPRTLVPFAIYCLLARRRTPLNLLL